MSNQPTTESFDDVQIGDLLIMQGEGMLSRADSDAVTVDRVTPRQIHIGGLRFDRKSGRQMDPPDEWGYWYLRRPKDGEIESLRERDRQGFLAQQILRIFEQRDQRNAIPLPVMRQIAELLGVKEEIDDD